MWQLWQVFLSLMVNVFWQNKLRASVHSYGKYNHGKNIMANEIEPNVGFPANINFCEKRQTFAKTNVAKGGKISGNFLFLRNFALICFAKKCEIFAYMTKKMYAKILHFSRISRIFAGFPSRNKLNICQVFFPSSCG